MKSISIIIEWFGPYKTISEASKAAREAFDDGLYAVVGKQPYERESALQYVGIASQLSTRVNGQHHKIPEVTKERSLWLGEVVTPRRPGKKLKVTDSMLDLAEWAHAYFLQLPLNENKTKSPPPYPVTVYNRWWKKDYETPFRRRPHIDWPDVIDFLGRDFPAKVVWFGGQQVVKSIDAFKE